MEAQERWSPTVLWKLPALQVIQVGRKIEAMVIPVAGTRPLSEAWSMDLWEEGEIPARKATRPVE